MEGKKTDGNDSHKFGYDSNPKFMAATVFKYGQWPCPQAFKGAEPQEVSKGFEWIFGKGNPRGARLSHPFLEILYVLPLVDKPPNTASLRRTSLDLKVFLNH